MAEVYIAHISEDGRNSQLLEDHLLNVAQLAKEFGASIGVPDMAYGCGLAHDFGKYSDKFQKYIRGEFQGKVDHSTAGLNFYGNGSRNIIYLVYWGHFVLPDIMQDYLIMEAGEMTIVQELYWGE